MPESVERRLSALVSADVAGYSKLMAQDEVGTVRTLTAYREEMGVLTKQHGGRVVDSPGDNILMEFPSATDAVEAAIEMQRVIAARNESLPDERRLRFRMGLHLGEVLVEDDRIYGDGVNIAARIEAVAAPGGVAMSDSVYSQVVNKVDAEYRDMGDYELKNIDRSIRIHQLEVQGTDRQTPPTKPEADRNAAWIVVLPFENLGGDPSDDFLADGLTEDIITLLSAFRSLRVIARTASFQYKGSRSPIPQIADELGVRFVLEGSVRRAGERIRVTAQLIEAEDQHHIWADKYEADVAEIFNVQDRITEGIVAAIDPAIRTAETLRASRMRPENIDAWGHVQRGWSAGNRYRREAVEEAKSHFRRALEIDPDYADAHTGLATCHVLDAFLLWTDDPAASLDLAYQEAKRATELDPRDAYALAVLAFVNTRMGRLGTAAELGERAIELNPSHALANAFAGNAHVYNGDPERGAELFDRAFALAPRDPAANWFLGGRGLARFLAGEPELALEDARAAIKVRYGYLFGRALIAASLIDMGRAEEAEAQMAEILEMWPDFDSHRFDGYHFRKPEHRSHFIDNLLTAGMPG
ncbi:MAG: tetratricopeptide repeat protein [Acidimicrobiia bacterium]|nr:tetratricopeptide repeat protein [Acidimicrobiia bacterium]